MNPHQILLRHIDRLGRCIQRLERLGDRFSRARLAIALIGAAVVFGFYHARMPGAAWIAAAGFTGIFAVIAHRHSLLLDGINRFRVWQRIKQRHLAALALDWEDLDQPESLDVSTDHPFSAEFNVVGLRSIHHLIDTTASAGGSERLASWLLDPAPRLGKVIDRQDAVRQLVPRGPFRDRLTLLTFLSAEGASGRWKDIELLEWLERRQHIPSLRRWLLILSALAITNIFLVLAHVAGMLPILWPYSLFLYLALYGSRLPQFKALFDEAHDIQRRIDRIAPALCYLEGYNPPRNSGLSDLLQPVQSASQRPSSLLRRIRRIATASGWTRSEFLWVLFNFLVPWEMIFTYLLDHTKRDLKQVVPEWLAVWYEMEALSALAHYADWHPGVRFPELSAEETLPFFRAEGLGHPLLPQESKVRNDFEISGLGAIGLITGSNMSGKSTFLRTVGVNLVLAFAGGAVDARSVSTSAFRLFASLNVLDSVQDGLSFFYAEVKRLRALLDASQAPDAAPLFFFIDEIFRGTNNRERLVGSNAYVRTLAATHGLGLISTHDLELVALENEIEGLRNLHFRESVSEGRMTFDYLLRPGPCPTTNALVIMRNEGLLGDPH